MPNQPTYVVVGASMAGGRGVEALREHGFDGRIVLIGAEDELPYERPPLSKGYLQGTFNEAGLYLHPRDYYEKQAIELRLGTKAVALDCQSRTLTLAGGAILPYDKLLIATGTKVRRLAVPGHDLDGVHYLRSKEDADRLASALKAARHVVVIGAGFIGSEVAASARALGVGVSVLEAAPVPLVRALGEEMGRLCASLHVDHGVDLRLSCGVRELRGAGHVAGVVTADGDSIPCDLVVAGIGVTPAVQWLAGSGIAIENGVLTNEFGETNVPDVYAAGDVDHWWHPVLGKRLRIEHYDNALNQGLAIGRVMAGKREAYGTVPYFWSDQYGLTLQYVGHARGDERLVVRGSVDQWSFTAFYVEEDRVRAAFGIGRPREIIAARRLIALQKQATPAMLADLDVDLRALAR